MGYIVSYRKASDQYTVYRLLTPEGAEELATVGDTTYVTIPDGETLPEHQPAQIADSIEMPVMTPELVIAIKAVSPQCKRIADRRIEMIREEYDINQEIFYARIGVGQALDMYTLKPEEVAELSAYKIHTENVRAWGHARYAELGLVVPDPE